jgi:polyisoprenyl-phosphate glycosyltransferase
MRHRSYLVVVPCYNEEQNIKKLVNDIEVLFEKNVLDCDLCIVDDGSTDSTWEVISNFCKKKKFIRAISLSKNFGKENAIEAALETFDYNNYIIADADLQHPLEKIPHMINIYENKKIEILNTYRTDNKEGFVREFFSKLFYKLLNNFSDIKIIVKTTDFMIISKKVRDTYIKINEKNKTFRFLTNWMGFKSISVPIEINYRFQGNSKYSFLRLIKLALNTFASFSIFPIKIISYLGLLVSLISILLLVIIFINYFLNFTIITWQTYFIITNLFFTGLSLCSIGLVGLYVSKINDNTNDRPKYIVEKKIDE